MEKDFVEFSLTPKEAAYLRRLMPTGFALQSQTTRKTRASNGTVKRGNGGRKARGQGSRTPRRRRARDDQNYVEEARPGKATPKRLRSRSLARGATQIWPERCLKMIAALCNHEHSGPFLHPVKKLYGYLPGYFDIIKQPIDLSTIKKRLKRGSYPTFEAFCVDVRLVWSNAMNYNEPDSEVYGHAAELQATFEQMVEEKKGQGPQTLQEMIIQKSRKKIKKISSPPPSTPLPSALETAPQPSQTVELVERPPTPKVDPVKKKELVQFIKKLKHDDLIKIWKIYTRYDGTVSSQPEIIINMESLPLPAFNEIYDFVSSTIERRKKEQAAKNKPKPPPKPVSIMQQPRMMSMPPVRNAEVPEPFLGSLSSSQKPGLDRVAKSPSKSSSFMTDWNF